MTRWRYADPDNMVVIAEREDGSIESHSVDADIIKNWISDGNKPDPYVAPELDFKDQAKSELANTDREMARIAEDLINIMVNNGLIKKEDLPNPVIAKLENRASLRKVLQADGD